MKRKNRKSATQNTGTSIQEGTKSNLKSTRRSGGLAIDSDPVEAVPSATGVSERTVPVRFLLGVLGGGRIGLTRDLSSKFWDGLIPMAALVLLTLVLHMLAAPIQGFWGNSGLLVYLVSLLGLGVVLLNHAILQTYSEIARGWLGLASGIVMWYVILLSEKIGGAQIPGATILLLLVVIGLVSAILWKSVFPIGIKFFVLSVFLAAVARFWITSQQLMATAWPLFNSSLIISGYVALAALVFVLVWIIVLSKERTQRLWAAMWGWFWALQVLSVFLGKPL